MGGLYKLQQNQTCLEFQFRCNIIFLKGSFNESRSTTGMCMEMQNRWRRYQDFGGDPRQKSLYRFLVFILL